MNKRLYLPTAILLIALFVSGCGMMVVTGSGKVVSETRPVSQFSAVRLEGIGDVIITQTDTTSLKIEAEDNLISYFDTSVQGDTLVIGIKNQYIGYNLRPTRPVKFYVSTPTLAAVTLGGSGNIITSDVKGNGFKVSLLGSGNITNDSLTATSVDINLAGSGNISLSKVTADTVTSTIAGSGNISLGGQVKGQTVKIVGSGDYLASGMQSQTATIHVTGSGNSQIAVSNSLDASILGSGDITYTGKPSVNSSITGSGHVRGSSE